MTGYYAEKAEAELNSLEVEGDLFQRWLHEIRDGQPTLIVGFNERDGDDIYDSAAVVEKGKLLGVQRKHYLYHPYFSSGKTFSPFHSQGICFGVVICLDTMYFEPSRLLALQGATILFSPMCNKVPLDHSYAKRPSYYSHFVARSFENRCWLISADWIWHNDGNFFCPGHTVVYDPDGREIKRSQAGKEQLLIIDIPQKHLHSKKGRRIYGSSFLLEKMLKMHAMKSDACAK